MSDDRICLGVIVGVHGIKGEVKVKSFTQVPEDIDQYGPVEDKTGSKKFDIRVTGHSKDVLRVKIKGVDDRNISETMIGTEFYVDRSLLPELEEEEFYHADLIGLPVKSEVSSVGQIIAVHNFGAGDLLEIKLTSGKTEMLPFTKAYVPVIDIKNGIIISETAIELLESGDKNEG